MPSQADRRQGGAEVPRIGRYRVCYRIAQGGMASVYLARLDSTAGFSKWVALKIIHPSIAADEKFVTMFLDEARLAARLDHPNLCTVFDFGEDDGRYYIAMEYLHGETLGNVARRAWAAQGALPIELGVRVVADAARGLHAAHELRGDDGRPASVVHRDVSPENVFVTYAGHAKLVDFGVARSNEQVHERTATGELKGKLAYMSPEQLHERRIDRRTDVWALGAVLWEITVGRRLFRRPTDAATVFAITRDPITPPSRMREDYPRDLEAIVMRALERDVSRRYQTAQEFSRALESWLAGTGRHASVHEVGEFMQLLFGDQMVWRERYLRNPDAPFRDLVTTWQAAPQPQRPAPPGLPDAAPEPSPSPPREAPSPRVAPPPPPPARSPNARLDAPRTSAMRPRTGPSPRAPGPVAQPDDDPEELVATAKAVPLRMPRPEPAEEPGVIPLTRRSDASQRTAALVVASDAAPEEARGSNVPLPPRRSRWGEAATILGLVVLGGVMALIWFDRPAARPVRRPARAAPARTEPAPPRPPSPTSGAPPFAPAARSSGEPPLPPPALPVIAAPPSRAPAAPPVAPAPAAPVERSRPRAPASGRPAGPMSTGYLTVTSSAPAEVFLGSRRLGATPLQALPLSPGVYSLRVVANDESRSVLATVPAGGHASVHVP